MKNITAIFDKIEPMMDRKNISGIVAVIDGDHVLDSGMRVNAEREN